MLRVGQLSALWNVAHETNLTFNLVRCRAAGPLQQWKVMLGAAASNAGDRSQWLGALLLGGWRPRASLGLLYTGLLQLAPRTPPASGWRFAVRRASS